MQDRVTLVINTEHSNGDDISGIEIILMHVLEEDDTVFELYRAAVLSIMDTSISKQQAQL